MPVVPSHLRQASSVALSPVPVGMQPTVLSTPLSSPFPSPFPHPPVLLAPCSAHPPISGSLNRPCLPLSGLPPLVCPIHTSIPSAGITWERAVARNPPPPTPPDSPLPFTQVSSREDSRVCGTRANGAPPVTAACSMMTSPWLSTARSAQFGLAQMSEGALALPWRL